MSDLQHPSEDHRTPQDQGVQGAMPQAEAPARKPFTAPHLDRHRELPAITAGSLNLGP